MRLTIAYSKIKKRNLVLINNDTHQRETVSERPIRPPLKPFKYKEYNIYVLIIMQHKEYIKFYPKTHFYQHNISR